MYLFDPCCHDLVKNMCHRLVTLNSHKKMRASHIFVTSSGRVGSLGIHYFARSLLQLRSPFHLFDQDKMVSGAWSGVRWY